MTEIQTLSSSFRKQMKVYDNHEKLVDVRVECPGVMYEIASYLNQDGNHPSETEDAYFVRESVADMISTAQSYLPKGIKFLLRCGYRTPGVQARQYKKDYEDLRQENPTWEKATLDIEIEKRTDPPEVGPHCTGGAIDISIISENGKKIDMGTNMGVFNLDTYTESTTISSRASNNRQILIDAMTRAGFLNFPGEWWHWSYGDREWAYAKNQKPFYESIRKRGGTFKTYPENAFKTTSNASN
jgi:D-alanyl-D-alanine dipeptidase